MPYVGMALAVNVGIASVKRGERGQIQTPVMDRALRSVFDGMPDTYKVVYDASHREEAWKFKRIGMLIPYSDAHTLTTI